MKKLINLNFTGVTRGIPLMKQYRNLFIILTVALFLTACGGGGGTTLSTSSGGGNGGGSTTNPNPNPPVVQKDIATLVMEAETAVGAIDDTTPTQDQVDAANTAIMAANAAIGALEDGDDKTTYMTQIDALRPTFTVAKAQVAVGAIDDTTPTQDQVDAANVAIMAADAVIDALDAGAAKTMYMTDLDALRPTFTVAKAQVAVKALGDPPYDKTTQDQVDAAQIAVSAVFALAAVLDPSDPARAEYFATASELQATKDMAEKFINADLNTAAMAKTDAGTAGTTATTFADGSPDITAIVDGQTISVAMGVSENIGTSNDVTTLNNKIAEIEKQLLLAERAKDNLDAAAVKLRDEIKVHNEDLNAALQGTGNPGDSQNEKILEFIAAADQLDREASSIEGVVTTIETVITNLKTDIAQLEMDIASASDSVIAAQKQMELNQKQTELDAIITTGDTTYPYQLPGDTQAMAYTYTVLKERATKAREAANAKKTERDNINKLVTVIQTKETDKAAKESAASATDDHIMAIEGVLNPLNTRFGVLRDVDALQSTKAGLVFDLLRKPLAGAGGQNADSSLKAVTNAIADLETMVHVFARSNNPDEAVTYVDYGMWLEGTDDALMLERRIGVVGPNQDPSNLDLGTDGSNTHTSATYEGEARGLSARTKGTRDDAVTASGHFIADVELNVEFGATAELAGTIDKFRAVEGQGGDHVDDDWSLELRGAADGNNEFDGRYFRGGSGHWTATPYGATNGARPAGFYGGFNAVFSDNDGGAAAGVYSTKEIPAE